MRYLRELLIYLALVLIIINSCSAIKCNSCQDCLNIVPSENSHQENITCGASSNACLKLTFKNYVIKGCSKATNCNAEGLMNNMENTWIHIKSVVGGDDAKLVLNNRVNADGSAPIACCTEDFCNYGRSMEVSSLVLGVASSLLLILK